MLAVNEAGVILLANREVERLFGYGPGELIGRSIDELVPMPYRHGHGAHREASSTSLPAAHGLGPRPQRAPPRRHRSAGRIGLNPVRTPEGVVVVASVVDISARLAAERRCVNPKNARAPVRRSSSRSARSPAASRNDFNNVLLAIVGYTELVSRSLPPQQQNRTISTTCCAPPARPPARAAHPVVQPPARDHARADEPRPRRARGCSTCCARRSPARSKSRSHLDGATPQVLADDTQMHQGRHEPRDERRAGDGHGRRAARRAVVVPRGRRVGGEASRHARRLVRGSPSWTPASASRPT